MAGIARREVEILVHATAPSRGQDDAQYRSLAQAYLDFEPATTLRLDYEPERISKDNVDVQARSSLHEELKHSTLEERESEASYRPNDERETGSSMQSSISPQNRVMRLRTSQDLDSPVLSFGSVLDNADSPILRELYNGSQPVLKDSRPRQQVSREIADSQPENNKAIPAFSSPARILELYLQQIQSSAERSSSSYGIWGHEEQEPSPELPYGTRHDQSGNMESVEGNPLLSSNVLSSPSPQKRREKNVQCVSRRRRKSLPSTQDPVMSVKRKWPESSLDDCPISSSAPMRLSIETSTVTTRTTRSRKRQCMDGSIDEVTRTKNVMSSQITMVSTPSASSSQSKSTWADQMEIRPPPPRTSIKTLTADMLITSSLQELAYKMPLAVLFRPKFQTRDLRTMERGHWIGKCGTWDPGVRKRCWECLGNFIGRGLVGWGVWCIRDEESDTIKIYCWGAIVGHVYLLLYMASESKIKREGACWVGGDGEVIITMPG